MMDRFGIFGHRLAVNIHRIWHYMAKSIWQSSVHFRDETMHVHGANKIDISDA